MWANCVPIRALLSLSVSSIIFFIMKVDCFFVDVVFPQSHNKTTRISRENTIQFSTRSHSLVAASNKIESVFVDVFACKAILIESKTRKKTNIRMGMDKTETKSCLYDDKTQAIVVVHNKNVYLHSKYIKKMLRDKEKSHEVFSMSILYSICRWSHNAFGSISERLLTWHFFASLLYHCLSHTEKMMCI